jgi:hypothetical protein
MNTDASTRAEYESDFDQLNRVPIIGDHTIGKLRLSVGPMNWRLTDGVNTYNGKVVSGTVTRMRIREALTKWLATSGIR